MRFLPGFFNVTIPAAPVSQIAVLCLDGDLYSSTMQVLRPLYPRVVGCGYVIVDDYGFLKMCKRAIHEFFQATPPTMIIRVVDDTDVWFPRPDRPRECSTV
mgnify:CR=1 FL=1